ncbi:MAG: type I-C CRISPR-associated endonuclease Cas1c [Acidobacteriaceae bacterium]
MKHLLNTLYVTTQGAWLARDGETVHVRVEGETVLRVPVLTLGGIVCFGNVSCSPFLMGMCAEKGVALSFLTEHGRFLARVIGPVNGNILLRREQYRRADNDAASTQVAKWCVAGKVANCRQVLLRAAREDAGSDGASALLDAAGRLTSMLRSLERASTLDELRGLEGEGARSYFAAFDHLILANKEAFRFTQRSRRPPLDNINALLSFLYTLLVHDVQAALECVGLDPAAGFLHRDRPGRPSLALDMMEELRPLLADRLALSLINRRQIGPESFHRTEAGEVRMLPDARKDVLVAWQKRKQEELLHPYLNEKIALGLLPHVQSMLLARHLRGDLDAYPAFLWR